MFNRSHDLVRPSVGCVDDADILVFWSLPCELRQNHEQHLVGIPKDHMYIDTTNGDERLPVGWSSTEAGLFAGVAPLVLVVRPILSRDQEQQPLI